MNLVYAEVLEISVENGMLIGRAHRKVPLDLLENIERGDKVLLCDGVAISKVSDDDRRRKTHVPGDSR